MQKDLLRSVVLHRYWENDMVRRNLRDVYDGKAPDGSRYVDVTFSRSACNTMVLAWVHSTAWTDDQIVLDIHPAELISAISSGAAARLLKAAGASGVTFRYPQLSADRG
ncbi:hypothetical protein GCM10007036_10390 [Alsobacter metallidurans]|uniref:Uncharacterized protein n=1 Tax=Alsobacter metallidurans TaxID=340221 RepID=A0A917MH26_9HYPH|nr:hypothetical protein [Alsobacter metallidurans]GGH12511.1 hypothetical protein GCM10007036_10390 [Alsobacter metallidurans]